MKEWNQVDWFRIFMFYW